MNKYKNEIPMDMEFVCERITPSIARDYLATSKGNPRYGGQTRVNSHALAQYANDMKEGHWRLSHQAIAFDKEGHLIDGHTRLNAIIKANIPVTTVVCRGCDPETSKIVDSGGTRSFRQRLLATYGHDAQALAPHCLGGLRIYLCRRYGYNATRSMSTDEMDPYVSEHEDELVYIASLVSRQKYGKRPLARSQVAHAFIEALDYGVSKDDIEAFCEAILTRVADEPRKLTALVVGDYLEENKELKTNLYDTSTTSFVQTGLWKFINDESTSRRFTKPKEVFTKANLKKEGWEE